MNDGCVVIQAVNKKVWKREILSFVDGGRSDEEAVALREK